MDVVDDGLREGVSGQCHEHLRGTLAPHGIVRGAPRGAGTEQQTEVIFLGELFPWPHVRAQAHQQLRAIK